MKRYLPELWARAQTRAGILSQLREATEEALVDLHASRIQGGDARGEADDDGAPPPWEGKMERLHLWAFHAARTRMFDLNVSLPEAAGVTLRVPRRGSRSLSVTGVGYGWPSEDLPHEDLVEMPVLPGSLPKDEERELAAALQAANLQPWKRLTLDGGGGLNLTRESAADLQVWIRACIVESFKVAAAAGVKAGPREVSPRVVFLKLVEAERDRIREVVQKASAEVPNPTYHQGLLLKIAEGAVIAANAVLDLLRGPVTHRKSANSA